MTLDGKIPDFITFPKTFENYGWYKPIIVLILSFIITLILSGIVLFAFTQTIGLNFIITVFKGGYGALNSPLGILFSDMMLVIFIPSLYIASKIVKDRPFSSYSSSRGGWNYRLYFKALIIPIILYVIYEAIDTIIYGPKGNFQVSIQFILVLLISIPLQCIAEEYVFRGFLMQTLGSWLKIPVLAIIIQAFIFAMTHGYSSIITLIEIFVLGFVCGYITWKTNGIEVASALHTANNCVYGLFIMLGLQQSGSPTNVTGTLTTIVFIIILGIIMYYVGEKTNWFGELPENSQNT